MRTWADSTPYRTGHCDGNKAAERDLGRETYFEALSGARTEEEKTPTDPEGLYLEGYERGYMEVVERFLKDILAKLNQK